jgi:orotidine-5'-phosphate decarboxylase
MSVVVSSPIIVALDVDSQKEALSWVKRLGKQIDIFKVGLQLFTREGPSVVQAIISEGKKVFLDLKLHDIPNTVAQAVRSMVQPGVEFLTLHASGGEDMLCAASESLGEIKAANPSIQTKLLAVTVLTSLDEEDLRLIGVSHSVAGQVLNLARMSKAAGIDGVVASPLEIGFLRSELGAAFLIVTPGIRSASDSLQDQKRVMTPLLALKEGSNFLVMGRSILDADKPEDEIERIHKELTPSFQ